MTACTHAGLRRVTPGGRCPLCEPRQDLLVDIERAITPIREVRGDVVLELRDLERSVRAKDANAAARELGYPMPGEAEDQHATVARVLEENSERARLLAEIEAINREIAEAEHLLDTADAAACRREFPTFLRFAWHEIDQSGRPFITNPGTDAIALHMQALADGVIKLLAIAVSPGFGKTSLASVAWPAFMWARDPSWRVICASHAFELARDIAGKFHRLVTSDWYRRVFPFVEVTGEALRAMTTSKGGTRYAVGVEGALTGLRSDAGLIDDSLNAIDAGSKVSVRAVNEWFEQGFSTRFDRRGREPAIGVIQQRLAENDLIALMRSLGAEVLELPARFETERRCSTKIWTDPRTVDGEVLAPEIHPKEYLDERERVMGARAFAGQYQQAPAPREGNQFKIGMWGWCALVGDGAPSAQRPTGARSGAAHVIARREDGSPDLDFAAVSIDATAGSTSEDASALAVGLFAGKDLRRFLLRDFTRGPAGWTETLRRVEAAIRASGLILVRQKKLVVLLEKKAMGASEDAPLPTQVRQMAAGQARREDGSKIEPFVWSDGSPMTVKLELYEPTGKGDKQQRADAMEVDIDAGLVMILEGADGAGARGEDWSPEYLTELGLFSGAGKSRDDRVDMTSQVIDHFRAPPTSSRFRDLRRAGRRPVR